MGDTNIEPWTPKRALAEIGHYAPDIRRLAAEGERSLAPIDRNRLAARLSAMQLVMTSGWSADKTTAWLAEMCRLLGDLPEDIVLAAIDDAVKAAKGGFMPSVGEIRAIADPRRDTRRKFAIRLRQVADYQAGHGTEQPAGPAEDYCDPAEAARIIDEFKLRRTDDPQEVRVRHDTPPRKPTDQDYAALMGITMEEFLRRREAMRAEIAEAEARNAAEMQAAAAEMAKVLAA